MPTFVSLVNFSDQGIRNYRDTTKRAQSFIDMVEKMGGKVKDVYWTMGAYDLVATMEAPDDETATAAALKVSALGNVRTTTMRAFNVEEMGQIIQKTE